MNIKLYYTCIFSLVMVCMPLWTTYGQADTTRPTATLTADPNASNVNPIHFNVTFSEPVTGFEASDLNVTNGAVTNIASSIQSTVIDTVAFSASTPTISPVDAAVDALGYIYIINASNNRIEIIDPNGGYFGQLLGNDQTKLINPAGIDIGMSGNIYVTDSRLNLVIVFDADRNIIRTIDGLDPSGERFKGPSLITIGPNDRIYVIDDGKIKIYDSEGNSAGGVASNAVYNSIDAHQDGTYYTIIGGNFLSIRRPSSAFVEGLMV